MGVDGRSILYFSCDLLRRADVRLESISEVCLSAVDAKIEELNQLSLSRGGQMAFEEAVERIYRLSNEIFAEAGTFGRAALGTAAHSLCEFTWSATADEGALWSAVEVHVQSMRVLRRSDVETSDQMCQAVLDGLRKVAKRTSERNAAPQGA